MTDRDKGTVVLAGGSGLIGNACRSVLLHQGYRVVILTRSHASEPHEVTWLPAEGHIDCNVLEGAKAVVNLCGIPLPEKRWTGKFKKQLLDSRVVPARFIGELIRQCAHPPECYVGMSATGIYGDQGLTPIREDDDIRAQGFLPDFVRAWEQAHRETGVSRTVILRTGVVIAAQSGYLLRFLLPSSFGIFPSFGHGEQILSWIHLADLARVIHHVLENHAWSGVLHATSPKNITQRDFVKALRAVTGRPGIIIPVPALLLRLVFGEMSDVLFDSADVRPERLLQAGFVFQAPEISDALKRELSVEGR